MIRRFFAHIAGTVGREKNPALIPFFPLVAVYVAVLVIHALFISYGTGVLVADQSTQEGAWCAAIFDSLGKNLLEGHAYVDGMMAGGETFFVDGREYVYYGPFPAFLRMPLNAIFPSCYSYWCRFACLVADGILLFFFALVLQHRLKKNESLSARQKKGVFYFSFLAFALGSPVIFLISASYVFHETVLWAFAWSVGAIYFLFAWQEGPMPRGRAAFGLGFCAGAAFLSRITYGVPWAIIVFGIVAWLSIKRPAGFKRQIVCALLPLVAALLFQAWYNDARFGSPLKFADMKAYQPYNAAYHRFFEHAKSLDVRRIPFNFFNYFLKPGKYFTSAPPWVHMDWASMHPRLHRPDYKEWLLPIPIVSLWLVWGAFYGALRLYRQKGANIFKFVPIGLLSQWGLLLTYFTVTHRYTPEFFPLLIFFYAFFLSECVSFGGTKMRLFAGLCALSIAINIFSTLSWTMEFNFDTPAHHRETLRRIFQKPDYTKTL